MSSNSGMAMASLSISLLYLATASSNLMSVFSYRYIQGVWIKGFQGIPAGGRLPYSLTSPTSSTAPAMALYFLMTIASSENISL